MSDPISALLIEDNPIHVRLLQALLQEAKDPAIHVEVANDLATGLERLQMGDIDVLLLDLVLPDSQEIATFERVHAELPTLPVIILTGLDDEDWAEEAVAAGASQYLVKTQIDSARLVSAVRAALETS
ncbi:MAG: glutamate dehydrogenase (NAD(P)+) [Candidatus Latescibacterota bacterium]|jgi:glutamate dehydrogenase (NAD(P)+)